MTKKTQNTITKAIFSTVTNTCDVHRRSSSVNALGSESMWVQQDTIAFHRNKLLEKMLDQLSWSTNAADEYTEKQKTRTTEARKRFNGDEISTTQLQAGIAELQSATLNAEILQDLYDSLQAAYTEDNGEEYTPYNRARNSNVTTKTTTELPAELAAQLAAFGLDGAADTVANTDGVDGRANDETGKRTNWKDTAMFAKKA